MYIHAGNSEEGGNATPPPPSALSSPYLKHQRALPVGLGWWSPTSTFHYSMVVSEDLRLWGLQPYPSHDCSERGFWERMWQPDLCRNVGIRTQVIRDHWSWAVALSKETIKPKRGSRQTQLCGDSFCGFPESVSKMSPRGQVSRPTELRVGQNHTPFFLSAYALTTTRDRKAHGASLVRSSTSVMATL